MKHKIVDERCGLDAKRHEFHQAMEKYNNNRWYGKAEIVVAVSIMVLQCVTVVHLLSTYDGTGLMALILAFIFAYIATDFVNGLVHMYMDNNTNYTSIVGPFVSSFHLHHLRPRSTMRHPVKIYFYESRTKFWLLIYLLVLAAIQRGLYLHYALNMGLVSIGVLSSVAEVSHYWCHNARGKNTIIRKLQHYRILLPMKHHVVHHRSDNMHYAFLNGISDPLINRISRYWYMGYKTNADQHAAAYVDTNTGL